MSTNPSLCIPRVSFCITKDYIFNVFQQLDIGKIDRVDIINKKTLKGEEYKCVFIHFQSWNKTDKVEKIKERLLLKNDVKIVYEFPWYWKISVNKYSKQ
jgi:hypothetical protein